MVDADEDENLESSTVCATGIRAFIEDIRFSLIDARFTGPIVALLGIILAYQFTVAPYAHESPTEQRTKLSSPLPLGLLRPHLSLEEMAYIQTVSMNAETEFTMPSPSKNFVKLRFHSSVTEHGTHSPPEMFYEGVTFGLTHENPYSLQYTAQSLRDKDNLLSDLNTMNPRPTHVMNRTADYNSTTWTEAGYAVHFSYADLAKQGKLSSDRRQPWKRVVEDILVIARDYKQVYITVWYPHSFGTRPSGDGTRTKTPGDRTPGSGDKLKGKDDIATRKTTAPADKHPHRFEVVIQEIIPTRTGLTGVKSSAAVWMSSLNRSAPHTFSPKGIHRAIKTQ